MPASISMSKTISRPFNAQNVDGSFTTGDLVTNTQICANMRNSASTITQYSRRASTRTQCFLTTPLPDIATYRGGERPLRISIRFICTMITNFMAYLTVTVSSLQMRRHRQNHASISNLTNFFSVSYFSISWKSCFEICCIRIIYGTFITSP